MPIATIPATPPHYSVNRVRVVDLPGLPLDDAVRGQAAYHLLSSEAVVRLALAHADTLGLPDSLRQSDRPEVRRALPLYVNDCLQAAEAGARATAEAIALRLGRNLAYILLTLHRGDACNRAARSEWTAAEWEIWRGIRHVWFGGGLMRGELGRRIVAHARALLDELGYGEALRLSITPFHGDMALLGAGRYGPAEARTLMAFDFGQTNVKRAKLTLTGGAITALDLLPSHPTAWVFRNDPTAAERYTGREVLAFVAEALCRGLEEAGVPGGDIMMSVAAYVDGGRLLGNGIYARMSLLGDDVRPLIAGAVRDHCGRAARVHPIHDGTAAAAVHACTMPACNSPAAVIVVGTALGIGFCPASDGDLRPVALDRRV
ncbi:MAG: hypothetical protein JXB35_02240 [Anaerolineae bacterium]|nr:hypothetical protein [Anaerolineae bacterium]